LPFLSLTMVHIHVTWQCDSHCFYRRTQIRGATASASPNHKAAYNSVKKCRSCMNSRKNLEKGEKVTPCLVIVAVRDT
jgi:hypothetical protein